MLGAAEEATAFFGEAAALCIQKQYINDLASPTLHVSAEDRNMVAARHSVSEDVSPRQLKHMQGNNLRDIPGNHHGASILGGAVSQSVNSGASNLTFYNTPSPIATQVIVYIYIFSYSLLISLLIFHLIIY